MSRDTVTKGNSIRIGIVAFLVYALCGNSISVGTTLSVVPVPIDPDSTSADAGHSERESIRNGIVKVEPGDSSAFSFGVSAIVGILGILVSALLLVWQIGRQFRNSLLLQRQNNREKLKLEVYSEYRLAISEALKKTGTVGTNASIIGTNLKIRSKMAAKSLPLLPFTDREHVFRQEHFVANDSLIQLIRVLEEFEIVEPRLDIFRTALSYASHCMQEAFAVYADLLRRHLPIDVPLEDRERAGTDCIVPPVLDKAALARIDAAANSYAEAALDASCFVMDLAREAQNIFLGELFGNKLQERAPIDSSCLVISTDEEKYVKLKTHFFENTQWGRDQRAVEDRLRKKAEGGP